MKNLAENFIKEIKDHQLLSPLYNSSVLVQTSRWTQAEIFDQYYDDPTPYPLFLNMKEDEGVGYISLTKHKNLAREVLRRYWEDPKSLAKIKRQYSANRERFHKLYPEILITEDYGVGVGDAERVEEARQLAWSINALAFFSIYLDMDLCVEVLSDLGEQKLAESVPEIWGDISEPFGESFERRRKTQVVKMLENGSGWKEIAKHLGYFVCSYVDIPPLSEISERLIDEYGKFKDSKRRQDFLEESRDITKKKQHEWNTLTSKLTEKHEKLASYIQDLIVLRDKRKDELSMITVLLAEFARSCLENANISQDYSLFVMYDELLKGVDYLQSIKAEIKKRPAGISVYVPYRGDVQYELGKFEESKQKIEGHFFSDEAADQISGETGADGTASGSVKVIRNLSTEKSKFNPGDVLVTGMTRPEFMPLLKQAGAVVTDEGGVTCHAAIVSRELELPCVIGTHNATRVLSDGDKVEVNADEGVVKILSKS